MKEFVNDMLNGINGIDSVSFGKNLHQQVFKMSDKNSGGTISKDEMLKFV